MKSASVSALVLCLTVSLIANGVVVTAAQASSLGEKLNAYIECTNRLSGRAYEARARYFSWAAKTGPTGKEQVIYGTYTIYDPSKCRSSVEAAANLEPRIAELESAASAYVKSVVSLEPLLKEADDYYSQSNYKDDKMLKGKALHPRLVAAWDEFALADDKLGAGISVLSDKLAADELAAIEKTDGKNGRYHIEAMMLKAKLLVRIQSEAKAPDLARITDALTNFEASVKDMDQYFGANADEKIDGIFLSQSKSFLTTAKNLMRRVRDKVPYSTGEQMIMRSSGGGWMVEGSPARLTRDYNQLVDGYNRGALKVSSSPGKR